MAIEIKRAEVPANDRPVALHLDSQVEELEEKIAPGKNLNHNETFVCDTTRMDAKSQLDAELDMTIEDLEEKIAPGHNLNHNETFVTDRS